MGDRDVSDLDGAKALVALLATAKADALCARLLEEAGMMGGGATSSSSSSSSSSSTSSSAAQSSSSSSSSSPSPLSPAVSLLLAQGSCVVLTADQVVMCDGSILEKPVDVPAARGYAERYRSASPSTVGALCLTHLPSRARVVGVDVATVRFDPGMRGKELVDELVEDGEPVLECAGGLMIENEKVRRWVLGIDGTEDSVKGLSKRLLRDLEVELKEKLKGEN